MSRDPGGLSRCRNRSLVRVDLWVVAGNPRSVPDSKRRGVKQVDILPPPATDGGPDHTLHSPLPGSLVGTRHLCPGVETIPAAPLLYPAHTQSVKPIRTLSGSGSPTPDDLPIIGPRDDRTPDVSVDVHLGVSPWATGVRTQRRPTPSASLRESLFGDPPTPHAPLPSSSKRTRFRVIRGHKTPLIRPRSAPKEPEPIISEARPICGPRRKVSAWTINLPFLE